MNAQIVQKTKGNEWKNWFWNCPPMQTLLIRCNDIGACGTELTYYYYCYALNDDILLFVNRDVYYVGIERNAIRANIAKKVTACGECTFLLRHIFIRYRAYKSDLNKDVETSFHRFILFFACVLPFWHFNSRTHSKSHTYMTYW